MVAGAAHNKLRSRAAPPACHVSCEKWCLLVLMLFSVNRRAALLGCFCKAALELCLALVIGVRAGTCFPAAAALTAGRAVGALCAADHDASDRGSLGPQARATRPSRACLPLTLRLACILVLSNVGIPSPSYWHDTAIIVLLQFHRDLRSYAQLEALLV